MLGYTWEWLRGSPSQFPESCESFTGPNRGSDCETLVAGAGRGLPPNP